MKKTIAIVLWISAIYAFPTWAQVTLEGDITDKETGEPLLGATIYLPDLKKGTVTDEQGHYHLEKLPKGTFSMQCEYVGYETHITSLTLNQSLQQYNFTLVPAVIESHEIVVSAGHTSTQEQNPVKVEEISAKGLDKLGGITLMEGLASIPGVAQVTTGAGIGKPVIRGLSFNRVVTFHQGIRLENQQWGGEHGLGLSDIGIAKIEIVKGPSSLLYGSDAMGGVLHVIDEKPPPVGHIQGDIGQKFFSNTQGTSTTVGIKGASKHLRFKVRGGFNSHTDYKDGNGSAVDNTQFNNALLKSTFGFNLPFMVTTLNYNVQQSLIGIPHLEEEEHEDEAVGPREMALPYQELIMHIMSLQNALFVGSSKVKVNVGYQANTRLEYEEEHEEGDGHDHGGASVDSLNTLPALDMQLNTFNYDVKWYLPPMKKWDIIFGAQGMMQQNTNYGPETLIPDASLTDAGVLSLIRYQHMGFNIQSGLRFDYRQIEAAAMFPSNDPEHIPALSREFHSINGALGGTYQLRDHLLFRANVASGFRAPNLAELTSDGVHHGSNRYEIGNRRLTNEQNVEGDLGFHYHSPHVSMDVAVYYNHIANYIYLAPQDTVIEGFDAYAYVQDHANLYGGEANLDIHPHPFDWIHFETTFSTVIGQLNNGSYLPLMPADRLKNELRFEFEDAKRFKESYVKAGLLSVFAQGRIGTDETPTPAYFLVHAGAGTNIQIGLQRISIYLTCNNLLDETYVDHLSALKPYNVYNMGRNVMLGFKIPIGITRKL